MTEQSKDEKFKYYEDLFRRLGAHIPEVWAASQVEGNDEAALASLVFLRQATSYYSDEIISSMIDHAIECADVNRPGIYTIAGTSINRMLEKGVESEDIVRIARVLIHDFFFRACYEL
jgi:hypothetical protein